MRSIVRLLLAILVAVPIATAVLAQDAGPATIRMLVEAGRDDDLRWPDFSDYRKHLVNFYEPLNYGFAWSRNGKVTPQSLAVIALFESADVKGINAVDYDGSRWGARLQALMAHPDDVALARFDISVSASLMRYISDLHIGRINPRNLRFELDIESKKYYLPKLLTQIKDAPDPAVMLSQIEPPYEEYRRLQRALAAYRQLAPDAAHDAALPDEKTVQPGDSYAGSPQLAKMLRRVGDLPASAKVDPKRLVYEGPLIAAVKHFQARHGLQPDGVISAKTFRALNTPLSFRVKQIQWALERWRWAPMEFDAPPIIVNIPEFVLRAWNEKGETQLAMRVVVGKAYSHQTPVFAAAMQYVVLRPYWSVPPSIQAKELVPKIAASPTYLARNNYELVTPDGQPLGIDRVDSDTLAKLRSFALQIRQKPGPNNALGLIKFIFPNQNNVYFHSTPSQELFSKTRRDFSHGCIRVEDPVALAQWVLRDQPQWTAGEIRAHMKDGDPTQVNLPKPIPIMIIYSTASVSENGDVHFFEDIYGHDETLENALNAGYPYPA
jgi:murein L,D-transpeptidase YcbB/YkuD